MEKYNYLAAVTEDVREYIENEINLADYTDRDELETYLNDELWICDRVTGNGSGSYTCNTWQAEENLAHNWDEIENVANEFGFEPKVSDGYEFGAEWWDVSIRCYYLGAAIAAVLDELEESGAFENSENDEESEVI